MHGTPGLKLVGSWCLDWQSVWAGLNWRLGQLRFFFRTSPRIHSLMQAKMSQIFHVECGFDELVLFRALLVFQNVCDMDSSQGGEFGVFRNSRRVVQGDCFHDPLW